MEPAKWKVRTTTDLAGHRGDGVVLRPRQDRPPADRQVRALYGRRPDPEGLLDEPFTMRWLWQFHAGVAGDGKHLKPDAFRRLTEPQLDDTERTAERRRQASLYTRRSQRQALTAPGARALWTTASDPVAR